MIGASIPPVPDWVASWERFYEHAPLAYAVVVAEIGKRNLLIMTRETKSGIYLDGGDLGEILLPGRYVSTDLKLDAAIDVFLYRDSEDRLVATTEKPYAMVGEFGYLTVKHVHARMGAFLDWGLAKDLLLPFDEQSKPLNAGDRVIVAVCIDVNTDRMMASARIIDHLSKESPRYATGDAVRLLVMGESPLGYTAIVDDAHLGLLYRSELSAPMVIGQRAGGFVREVRPDGKIDLGLDAAGYERIAPLTEQIIEALRSSGGRMNFDDESTPDEIRLRFGVSKRAFKQALGALFRERRISFMKPGIELSKP